MNARLAAAWALLPEYLAWHVLLSASALVLGVAISLPLAVAAARSARLRWPVLAGASLIQTIPSLALLALFYPVLLAVSALSLRLIGRGFPALGFLPSLLALTLYSMLPVPRNTVTALIGIDPAIRMAAQGVGSQVHYIPVHTQPFYRRRYGELSLPGAMHYYQHTLSLPLYASMTVEDVDRVVAALSESLKGS